MENNTSPQHGGNIPKKDRTPMSFLKTHTPDASPESKYPPATEQPEEGYVVGLRADSFESVCQVVTENQVLQAKFAASEKRVKALESENETLREIVSESCAAVGSTCRCSTKASLDFMAGVPGEIRMTVDALQERANLMDSALREIRSAAIRGIHGDFLDVNVVGIANKALEAACQK